MSEISSYEAGTPSWVDVASPDIDASVAFYGDLFEWRASEGGDPEETGGYRLFEQDGKAVAGIGPIQTEGQPPAWTTYISVEDVDATTEKVKAAGGSVLSEPMDVMTAGRMAVLADPGGAVFAIWQAREHIGAGLVNEPVSLTWNELRSRDPEGSKRFYADVFGWNAMPFEQMPGYTIWTLGGTEPGNGKGGMIDMAAVDIPAEVPPHWDVAFAVDDADATAAKCTDLGGIVAMGPMDSPVGRMAMLQDLNGATFTVIKLVPQEDAPQA
ncbi:MAG: VOC family protein [Thermoleophilia bacterium]|nr:VOC family protein [Thermoleophilia bacterium]